MGSTILLAKSSAAFVRPDGQVVYALSEKTFESNVHPHTPHWSCFAFGTYDAVMKRVFGGAEACEGGYLKAGNRRDIRPESYISSWQLAMKTSVRLDDMPIVLRRTGSYRGPVTNDKLDATVGILIRHGYTQAANALANGEQVELSLFADTDVLLALYGVGGIYAPWMILTHAEWRTIVEPAFAPERRVETIVPPTMEVYSVKAPPGWNYYVVDCDGTRRAFSAEYSAVQYFIEKVAYPLEMKRTGCSGKLITAFREQCKNAPQLPLTAKVTVSLSPDLSVWYRDNYDKVAKAIGLLGEGQERPARFDCTLGDIVEKGVEYSFFHLHDTQVEWHGEPQAIPAQSTAQFELVA